MRPPRYRFPDEIRPITRNMAAKMIKQDLVPGSAAQLNIWLEATPAAKEALQKYGWGTKFTSDDLFPLLQVFVANASRAEG